jgi:1,2-diacylglycerol 3-alpha-glucosyltransferase
MDSVIKFCLVFFFVSARFIPKKNLFRLMDAYSIYRFKKCNNSGVSPWDLTLLGDGDLRYDLDCIVRSLGLQEHIKMPGFKQYDELPAYYKEASVFIHASTTEQWGLVVNEAMASGLPVLVSSNCGCTPDLVHDGVNGFSFDPYDPEALAEIMFRMTAMPDEDLLRMGRASEKIIADWGPQRFSQGLLDAAKTAQSVGICRMGLLDKMLVKILSLR